MKVFRYPCRSRRICVAVWVPFVLIFCSGNLRSQEGPGILIHDRNNFGNDSARATWFSKIENHPLNVWITRKDGIRESFYQKEIRETIHTPSLRANYLIEADFEKLRSAKLKFEKAISTYPRTKSVIEPFLKEIDLYLKKGESGLVFYQGNWMKQDDVEGITFVRSSSGNMAKSSTIKPPSSFDRLTPVNVWIARLDQVPLDFLAAYLQASDELRKRNATAYFHHEKENGNAGETGKTRFAAPPPDAVSAHIRKVLQKWEPKNVPNFGGQVISEAGKNCSAKEANTIYWNGVERIWNRE